MVAELHFKRFLVLSKLPKKDHKNNKTWPKRIFLFLFWVSIKIHNSLKKEKTRNKKIKLAKLKHPKKTFIFVLVLTFGFDTIEYLFSVLKKGKRQHKNVKRRN